MLEAFVDQLRIIADRRSPENRPEICLHTEQRSLPFLGEEVVQPTLVVLPFSCLGGAPSLARRLEMHNKEAEAMEHVCQALLEELVKYVASDVSSEDEKIWKYNMEMRIRRARSLWGDQGLMNDDAGLFTRESETIRGSGFRDQICFYNEGERLVLAEAKYTQYPAPLIDEFEVKGERERGLFKALVTYIQAAHRSRLHPISLVYVHITNRLEEFPHGFLKGVANRLLDFGQHTHSINADLLVLSTADSVHALSLNMQVRERNFLTRRIARPAVLYCYGAECFRERFPFFRIR